MPLAIIIGHSDFKIPKASQVATPKVKVEYILREMADVSFVRSTFMACGTKASVVQAAAK